LSIFLQAHTWTVSGCVRPLLPPDAKFIRARPFNSVDMATRPQPSSGSGLKKRQAVAAGLTVQVQGTHMYAVTDHCRKTTL